jgi:hypothetical protein
LLNKLDTAMLLAILLISGLPSIAKAQLTFDTGVSLSPKSYEATDFNAFFQKAKQAGNIISWAGDWDSLGAPDKAPEVIAELASIYDYVPLIEAQFFTQSSGQLLRPLNDTIKQNYKNSAIQFANKYKPKYLAFGIEVNILYDKSPADFEDFVEFYGEVCDAVKGVSQNTSVFTVFQLEKMKGLNGGLFGGENNFSKAQWFLLERFPKSDIIAFTTYPSLIFKNCSEIPPDYYSEISAYTTKPIAFTEMGWHTAPTPLGWEGNEETQRDFVRLFFNYTESLNKEIVVWSFLYDQNVTAPFNSMGFFGTDGNPKLAWNTWTQLVIPEFSPLVSLPLLVIVTLTAAIADSRRARKKVVNNRMYSSAV